MSSVHADASDSTVVSALIETLQDGNVSARVHAAMSLWKIRSPEIKIIEALRQALGDSSRMVSTVAAAGLWGITDRADESVPVLVKTMQAGNTFDRMLIMRTLRRMGRKAEAAAPAVEELLGSADPAVRCAARETLQCIRKRN